MVYVVACEVIRGAHARDHARAATWATMAGFVVNTVLDGLLS